MQTGGLTRRAFLGGGLTLASSIALAAEPGRDVVAEQDFDELWRTIGERYCFFSDKAVDWNKVRAMYRPRAAAANTLEELTAVVHQTLAELYDAHTHLSDPPDGTPRFPGYDMVVERRGELARVLDVLEDGAGARAGVRAGDEITTVDGTPIAQVAAQLGPRCLTRPDPAAEDYAWNVAVAGRTGTPRTLGVRRPSERAAKQLRLEVMKRAPEPDLSWRRLDGGLGYVRIASFADKKILAQLDEALVALRETPGLIFDVRRNGGGDTAVARPIMGRFIRERLPYARMRRREGTALGEAWTEHVEPRGPFTYTGRLVVLVDHFSGSMAEGFPMGLRAIAGARVVGTKMAALGAAVFKLRLDRTGITAQYSAEPVYDASGAPRWLMRPDVEVRPGEDGLAVAAAELARSIASR